MNKKYVFLTDDIHPVGGEQLYVAGKASYLARNGWDVRIIFPGQNTGASQIGCLQPYICGGVRGIWRAPFKWGRLLSRIPLRRMLQIVGECSPESETIIESNTGELAQWGELLASELKARHVCLICNEVFRGSGKTYDRVLDFFKFKLDRGELYGIAEKSLHMLFGEYLKISDGAAPSFFAAPMAAVQEVDDSRLAEIDDAAEWTICHIGRAEKDYVERMIYDFSKFCSRHEGTSIQIIFVGDISCRQKIVDGVLSQNNNVKVVELGNMVPIPRQLFSMVDVVVASSGCAIAAVAADSPTIIADAGDGMSNGVFDVDTHSTLFREEGAPQEGFDDTLERVLVGGIRSSRKCISSMSVEGEAEYRSQLNRVKSLQSRIGEYETGVLFRPRGTFRDGVGSLINVLRIIFNIHGRFCA